MKKEDKIAKTEDKKSDVPPKITHLRKILYVWSRRKFFSYESNLERNIMNKKINKKYNEQENQNTKTHDNDNQYNKDWWWW